MQPKEQGGTQEEGTMERRSRKAKSIQRVMAIENHSKEAWITCLSGGNVRPQVDEGSLMLESSDWPPANDPDPDAEGPTPKLAHNLCT